MKNHLIETLSQITEEERRIIKGEPLNITEYTSGDPHLFSSAKLTRGKHDIILRPHTRYIDFPQHSHNFVEMVTVISGSLTNIIGTKEIKLEVGDILLMNKHVSHSIKRADTSDIGINVIMSDLFFNSLAPSLEHEAFKDFFSDNNSKRGEGSFLLFRAAKNTRIENLIENLLFELTDSEPHSSDISGTVSLLLSYLFRFSAQLLAESSTVLSRAERNKIKISAYISNNYRLASLAELASIMNLSIPYLSKLICEYFGKSFKELLIDERMTRASELLSKTDLRIDQVIVAVGYENSSYFHRTFKKIFGKTPLSYRKLSKAVDLTQI